MTACTHTFALHPESALEPHGARNLFPIMASVFAAFFVIGLAIPVIPLHVHDTLRQSTFIVGLVTGFQFAASIVSRVWAGRFSDSRGPKQAVIVGLVVATLSGGCY